MHKTLALCKARHEMPCMVEGSIFSTDVNPLDVAGLQAEAVKVLAGVTSLTLYVTGLTVALVAVINACTALSISLELMHFNRENGEYYSQRVL